MNTNEISFLLIKVNSDKIIKFVTKFVVLSSYTSCACSKSVNYLMKWISTTNIHEKHWPYRRITNAEMKQKLLEFTKFKFYHYIMLESLNKIKNTNKKECTKGGFVRKIIEWLDFPAYQTANLSQRDGAKEIKSSRWRSIPGYLTNK